MGKIAGIDFAKRIVTCVVRQPLMMTSHDATEKACITIIKLK